MSDVSEVIQESIENARENQLNSKIALFVAFIATVMAIFGIKSSNIAQNMSMVQAHTNDTWSFFQAKSTKQSLSENTLQILKLNPSVSPDVLQKLENKISQYEKEKEEIKQKAENLQKEYEQLNVFDDQFDMTEAFLSIALSMFGLTALTQKKWLFYFALSMGGVGLFFGGAAFMHISLHSEFISSILG